MYIRQGCFVLFAPSLLFPRVRCVVSPAKKFLTKGDSRGDGVSACSERGQLTAKQRREKSLLLVRPFVIPQMKALIFYPSSLAARLL